MNQIADKTDFKKTDPGYKAKRGEFSLIELPEKQYLMIDGDSGPGSADFAAAIETLYPVAYALKFRSKKELGRDYVVPPLQALWWAEDMSVFTTGFDQSQWLWTAMILTPDWITPDLFEETLADVAAKKSPPKLDGLRLAPLNEGLCVQILHVGPFSDEGPDSRRRCTTSSFPEQGLALTGKHHEIYFSDFRKVAPEKLRTILRQPVVRQG